MEKNETYSIAQYLIDKNKQRDSSQRTTKGTTTKKKTIYIVERVDDRPPRIIRFKVNNFRHQQALRCP